jgi:hypothetical protein
MVLFPEEWHETIVEMLKAVIRERPRRMGRKERLTCIQQIQSIVQDISLIYLGITAENYKGVSHQKTGVTDSRTRAFRSGRDGKA